MKSYRLIIVVMASLTLLTLLSACGGATASQQTPTYSPAVTPLSGADAQNVSSIKAADGSTPCGAFDVNGFGYKTVDLKAFPDCKASAYTVMCLNGSAQWIGDNVSEVKFDGTTLTFTSKQEGTCALFAANKGY